MAIILSLLTAVIYGTSDFCGGLATRRANVVQVVAGSHLVGLLGALCAALLVADRFDAGDFALGAVGGAFGAVAITLLYRRLAIGPMQVVAPLTAVTSAVVPAAWGVTSGDEISPTAWVGVGLGLAAIGLVSRASDGSSAPVTAAVIAESLAAGAGFGAFFILLDATEASSAPWPVVGARLCTVVALVPYMRLTRRPMLAGGTLTIALIATTGLLDTAANVTFLYASDRGLLTLVAVISSLYPVATVILARLVLAERVSRHQMAGFLVAMAATVLIAAA